MEAPKLKDIYQNLIVVNRNTFDGGEYDVAFHVLMAALHCGHSLKEIPYLLEVEQIAAVELAWIDSHHPEYEHSTQSAAKRGHQSIFYALGVQANATVALMKSAQITS